MPQCLITFTPDGLQPFIERLLFTSRERLVALLAQDADRAALETEFREFFEGYIGLGFLLEDEEASLLAVLEREERFSPLHHRVKMVESQRKSSPDGRIARRMGVGPLITEPQPEIKVIELRDADFRALLDTLVSWPLFAARERLAKCLKDTKTDGAACFRDSETAARLKPAFMEFFVCYLELEQFLEGYDYHQDEGLEMRPEVLEEWERSIAEVEAGGKTYSLEEVAKELGLRTSIKQRPNAKQNW